MNQKLSISAVIPAYNAEKYIARCLDSVLAQTCPVDEIIVVDDGSKDKTADIVRSYGDKVKLIQQENAGVSAARNTGILAATGDWIAFLDADDEWLPQKIELQTANLQKHPDLVWTTGNYDECLCDENRRAPQCPPQKIEKLLNGKGYFNSYFEAWQHYLWGHTNCMLIKKTVFSEVGNFCAEFPIAEDIDLWLRIAYRYPKIGFSSEPLATHYLFSENTLMTTNRQTGLYARFMERHLSISAQQGVLEQFRPAAAFTMRRWIRGMLFSGRKAEIRQLLSRFPQLCSVGYRLVIYSLTAFPSLTVGGLRLLSKVVRTLKLRRRVTRRPPSAS